MQIIIKVSAKLLLLKRKGTLMDLNAGKWLTNVQNLCYYSDLNHFRRNVTENKENFNFFFRKSQDTATVIMFFTNLYAELENQVNAFKNKNNVFFLKF